MEKVYALISTRFSRIHLAAWGTSHLKGMLVLVDKQNYYYIDSYFFFRISISFNDHSYIATLNDKNIFIVCVKKGGE